VWDRLLRLPTTFFSRHTTGELSSAALGITGIRTRASSAIRVVIMSSLLAVANFGLLLWYSVPLALMTAVLLALHAVVFAVIAMRIAPWQREKVGLYYKLTDQVLQTLRGLPKLRVAAAESFAYARWAGNFSRNNVLLARIERAQILLGMVAAGSMPLGSLLLFAGLSGPLHNELTMVEFLGFVTAFSITLAAMAQLGNALVAVTVILPMFDKIRPIFDELPEVSAASTVPGELTGDIEIANVSFSYAPDSPVILKNVSLHIQPGEFVAIVGPTGCGKSTLLRLLIGFNEPSSGAIRYDGSSLTQLDLSEVRNQCGVVLQHSVPLGGTILSNICGTSAYTIDEAWEAAKLAGLDEDIKRMPMGMHTLVSDTADTLSGGQRQRLMIAQALIRKPKIIFFDEATSALDNKTQQIVTDSTTALSATRVVIAHRLSTIMHADRVVMMSAGQVAEVGPPAELLADTNGMFHALVSRQRH
jgi:NHLM bacteriocin system ABC transporter ATP-binding protein